MTDEEGRAAQLVSASVEKIGALTEGVEGLGKRVASKDPAMDPVLRDTVESMLAVQAEQVALWLRQAAHLGRPVRFGDNPVGGAMGKKFQQLAGHVEAGLAGVLSPCCGLPVQAAVSVTAARHEETETRRTSSGADIARDEAGASGDQPDPAQLVLTQRQNWRSHSHQELYDSIHREADPVEIRKLGAEWAELGLAMKDHSSRMEERASSVREGWRGAGADSVLELVSELVRWPGETARFAEEVGRRVDEQGRIIEQARAAMPRPVVIDWDTTLTSRFSTPGLVDFLGAVRNVRDDIERADAAHDEAIRVMTEMETASQALDARIAALVAPAIEVPPASGRRVVQHAEQGR